MNIYGHIKKAFPNPLKQLPWRLQWLRKTTSYKHAPVATLARLLMWTAAECIVKDLRFQQDGLHFITMRNNFCGLFSYVGGDYEKALLGNLKKNLSSGGVFCDVGANIGMYSVTGGRSVGESGRVIAIEAHPLTFQYLERNIALNQLTNIIALNVAVGAESQGNVEMEYSHGNSGSTHVANGGSPNTVRVAVMTLDDILKQRLINRIDFLKLDVEGFEVFALKGARNTLIGNPQIIVQTEIDARMLGRYQSKPEEVVSFLESLGFIAHEVNEKGLVHISAAGLEYGDIIWKRSC
jgi:FkbM family methyltransferase